MSGTAVQLHVNANMVADVELFIFPQGYVVQYNDHLPQGNVVQYNDHNPPSPAGMGYSPETVG
jgi:hypothetical protein